MIGAIYARKSIEKADAWLRRQLEGLRREGA